MSNLKSDNAVAGGITYSTPAFIFGSTGSVNGGYSFDLPLATVAAFNNQGLDFLAANTQNARGFFLQVEQSASNALQRTENSAFSLARSGLGTLQNIANASIASQERINYITQTESTRRIEAMPEPDSGFCFITTAVCEAENLPDDCHELTTLRRFRDEYMMRDPALRIMVGEYYDMAPAVVEKIKALPSGGKAVFAFLKANYILPAIVAIEAGKHSEALKIYRAMCDVASDLVRGA